MTRVVYEEWVVTPYLLVSHILYKEHRGDMTFLGLSLAL
jgi:hypothetical protein